MNSKALRGMPQAPTIVVTKTTQPAHQQASPISAGAAKFNNRNEDESFGNPAQSSALQAAAGLQSTSLQSQASAGNNVVEQSQSLKTPETLAPAPTPTNPEEEWEVWDAFNHSESESEDASEEELTIDDIFAGLDDEDHFIASERLPRLLPKYTALNCINTFDPVNSTIRMSNLQMSPKNNARIEDKIRKKLKRRHQELKQKKLLEKLELEREMERERRRAAAIARANEYRQQLMKSAQAARSSGGSPRSANKPGGSPRSSPSSLRSGPSSPRSQSPRTGTPRSSVRLKKLPKKKSKLDKLIDEILEKFYVREATHKQKRDHKNWYQQLPFDLLPKEYRRSEKIRRSKLEKSKIEIDLGYAIQKY